MKRLFVNIDDIYIKGSPTALADIISHMDASMQTIAEARKKTSALTAVQNLLGTLGQAHQQMARMSKADANRVSVRIELQADFYAGVWAHYEKQMFKSIEQGDLEEAIRCASVIGDDYLQKKSQGYAVEESFTHGTAAQRMRWLKKGMDTGDLSQGDTFSLRDNQL